MPSTRPASFLVCAVAAIGLFTSHIAQASSWLLDSFTTPQTVSNTTPAPAAASALPVAPGVGDASMFLARSLTLTQMASQGPVNSIASIELGVLDVTNGAGDVADARIEWTLPAISVPSGPAAQIEIIVTGNDATLTSLSLDLNALPVSAIPVPGGPSGHGAKIFTLTAPHVAALQAPGGSLLGLTVTGSEGFDMKLSGPVMLRVTTVSTPASIGLFAAGLIVMIGLRRRFVPA